MEWSAQVDIYCERLDASFWAEPLNATTNLAFVIAALIMWRRSSGFRLAQVLCFILFVIGIGSFLFHTFATQWASLADVVPIGVFILTYLFAVNRTFLGMNGWVAFAATLLFAPYAYVMVPLLTEMPFLRISNFYWTVPLLLLIYAAFVWRHSPNTARGMVIGAAILSVSITLRSFDLIWCDALPFGTHFLWHTVNAVMLAWMIHVYLSHMVAGAATAE